MSIEVENIETCTKTALGELLLRANSNELVKRVLTAFDPFASKTVQLRAIASFKLEALEACAEFLDVPLADSEDNKIYTKETLQFRILLAIKALLPATCSDCSQLFRNQFDAEVQPSFFCFMCFQGAHDCAAIKSKADALQEHNIALPGGMIWLCHDCHKKSNPVVPRRSKSRHNSVANATPANSRPQSPERSLAEQLLVHDPPGTSIPDPSDLDPPDTAPICEKYKSGKCPHGLRGKKIINGTKCQKRHPKRCFTFCKNGSQGRYGCKNGVNCNYYHPTLCKFSLRNRICTNSECTFVHLKGTKRSLPTNAHEPDREEFSASNAPHRRRLQSVTITDPNPNRGSSGGVSGGVTTDHFLELKGIVELMSRNLQQQQQDIATLRSNILQHHTPFAFPPQALQAVQHQFNPNPVQLQNHPFHKLTPHQPTMPFIPQSTC